MRKLFPALAAVAALWANSTAYAEDVHYRAADGINSTPVSAATPLPVTGTITPSGTQNVNLTQIQGAAPSLTNPIWIANAEAGDTTGTFTNATQTTAITATNVDGYATGLLSINGTYGTASGIFEASDDAGTTWYTTLCTRSDGTASETGYTSLTNVSRQWQCPTAGNDSLRIRSTAVASGTVNGRISISAPPTPSAAVVLNPGSSLIGGVKLIDTGGTNAASVSAAGALNVSPDNTVDAVTQTASASSAATIYTFTAAQLQGMDYISFGFTSVGSGNTVVVDQAPDGTTYNGAAVFWRTDNTGGNLGTAGNPLISQAAPTTAMQFVTPVSAPTMRIRVSTYGSGTVTVFATAKRGTIPQIPVQVVQAVNTTGNASNATADSGNPVKTGCKVSAPLSGLTPANRQDNICSTAGGLFVEQDGMLFNNITTATTTTVKSGAGIVHEVCVNTEAALATITAYDNTAGSGTKIGSVTNPATLLQMGQLCFWHDIAFSTGLTIVTTGAQDITVTYR